MPVRLTSVTDQNKFAFEAGSKSLRLSGSRAFQIISTSVNRRLIRNTFVTDRSVLVQCKRGLIVLEYNDMFNLSLVLLTFKTLAFESKHKSSVLNKIYSHLTLIINVYLCLIGQ